MGWAVRQFLRGKRPQLDPIRAARTAVLAKASCYTGALLAGWYGGQVLALVSDLDVPGNGSRAVAAGVATAGAVVLAVVGLVVEWFCRVPPPEDGAEAARERPAPDPERPLTGWKDDPMTSDAVPRHPRAVRPDRRHLDAGVEPARSARG